MGEQASLEFDLTFGDVLLHKLVQAYWFNMLRYILSIINEKFEKVIYTTPNYIDETSLHLNKRSIGDFG